MTAQQPGEPADPGGRARSPLDRAPSARYSDPTSRPSEGGRASPVAPIAKGLIAATVGSAVLVLVGAVLASTFGLLFVAGATGAAIGLLLARARVPNPDGAAPAMSPRAVTWLAVALTLAALIVADAGTWVIARGEGGTLGPIDYLLETFGPFVAGEAILGVIGAAWGASAGPVQG